MGANFKRLLALGFCVLFAAFVGVCWGVVLAALGEPLVDRVQSGAAALGGTAALGVAVIMLFPFRDGGGGAPPMS
ncbi:hypothetical protein SSP531S_06940 [Streptomyces spongiicola]|uniref:DUF2964 domain-containing protein n=1 Tax=Streptomyces spongiicola TaxID=1690221 RepID=A0A388SU65_9ACTN|nr:hypothetical protein SSP531S_06940 [Streptomyces spongiicola]